MPPSKKRKKASRTKRFTFPYVRFHGNSYPLIPVTLSANKRSVNTFGLLDTGASVSVFRPEIARALGIKTNADDRMGLITPGGNVRIDLADVKIQVEDMSFRTVIGFSKKYTASFNILGRAGFFHKFSVCFNEVMNTVILVPLEKNS